MLRLTTGRRVLFASAILNLTAQDGTQPYGHCVDSLLSLHPKGTRNEGVKQNDRLLTMVTSARS